MTPGELWNTLHGSFDDEGSSKEGDDLLKGLGFIPASGGGWYGIMGNRYQHWVFTHKFGWTLPVTFEAVPGRAYGNPDNPASLVRMVP